MNKRSSLVPATYPAMGEIQCETKKRTSSNNSEYIFNKKVLIIGYKVRFGDEIYRTLQDLY